MSFWMIFKLCVFERHQKFMLSKLCSDPLKVAFFFRGWSFRYILL